MNKVVNIPSIEARESRVDPFKYGQRWAKYARVASNETELGEGHLLRGTSSVGKTSIKDLSLSF
jgi:hypothetical protein